MDLRTFVAETLRQIVAGVADAQTSVAALNTNARVNPALIADTARKSANPSPVEFDVALTVSERTETSVSDATSKAEGLISVVSSSSSVATDKGTATDQQSEAFSRVRFTVQLAQPADIETYSTNIPTMRSMGDSSGY